MDENNNVYYDLDNDGRNDDFLSQERQNEQNERGRRVAGQGYDLGTGRIRA